MSDRPDPQHLPPPPKRWLALLLWVVMGLLTAYILWLALAACGLRGFAGSALVEWCDVDAASEDRLVAEKQREEELRRRYRDMERQLADLPSCSAVEPEQTAGLEGCPVKPADDVLLVVDLSLSMSFPFDLDPAVEDRLYELQASPDMADQMSAAQLYQEVESSSGPDRIDVAKSALEDIVETAPEDVRFGLVSFNLCGNPDYLGDYGYPQRPDLVQTIRGLSLDEYTALADTLSVLDQFTEAGRSVDRPLNIVLLSDGVDSCGGDPCAAARQLKSDLPESYVHVIAISRRLQELSCISEATGGTFVEADDAEQFAEQLRQASGQDLPADCR